MAGDTIAGNTCVLHLHIYQESARIGLVSGMACFTFRPVGHCSRRNVID